MIVDMLLGSAKPWPWGDKGVKDLAFISQQLKKNKKCCMLLELWNNEDHKSLIYEWQKLVNEKFQDNAKVEVVLEDAEASVEVWVQEGGGGRDDGVLQPACKQWKRQRREMMNQAKKSQ